MLETGAVIDGKYKIIRRIGQGGMSVVYLAVNERANKYWAVKEVRRDGSSGYETVKQNLVAETDILKKLSHPCFPSIVDIIDRKDTFLVVMDYIRGRPLTQVLEQDGVQSQERVLEWAIQICDALIYLHSRIPPVIYRDMKPSNLMLKPDGKLAIIDFGAAREYKDIARQDTLRLGTRGYAAPEQFLGGGQTDARTDIYGLGATLYHLLTGHNPCLAPYQIYPVRRWNPALSSVLEDIILKCTKQNPEERYQSCQELKAALLCCQKTGRQADSGKKRKKKLRLLMFLAALCAFVVPGVRSAGNIRREKEYQGYIRAAERTDVEEDRLQYYQAAVQTDPGKAEAYRKMLDCMTGDRDFSKEEAGLLQETLQYRGKGFHPEPAADRFMEMDMESYAEFAFDLGIAFYYYYDGGTGNKEGARSWFLYASGSETLEESLRNRAGRLAEIGKYYSTLGIADSAGQSETGYGEYWEDLVSLMEGNLVKELDNEAAALAMYRELAYQIFVNADQFRRAHVSRAEMEAQIRKAREHLRSDFPDLEGEWEKMRLDILDSLDDAGRQVATAFSRIALAVEQESEK